MKAAVSKGLMKREVSDKTSHSLCEKWSGRREKKGFKEQGSGFLEFFSFLGSFLLSSSRGSSEKCLSRTGRMSRFN